MGFGFGFTFGFIAKASPAPSLGALVAASTQVVAASNNPITATAMNIGTANAKRWVIACISAGSVARTWTSCTIGGVTATKVADSFADTTSTRPTSIWVALVPTGTTADVVVTMSGGNSIAVALYTTIGDLNTTPFNKHETGGGTGSSPTALNTPVNGVAVGVIGNTSTVSSGFDVQDINGQTITTGVQWSAAHKSGNTDGSQLIINFTNAGASNGSHCFASFAVVP